MDRIFTAIRAWLDRLLNPERPADPTETMSPRELADLPTHHPRLDRDCLAEPHSHIGSSRPVHGRFILPPIEQRPFPNLGAER